MPVGLPEPSLSRRAAGASHIGPGQSVAAEPRSAALEHLTLEVQSPERQRGEVPLESSPILRREILPCRLIAATFHDARARRSKPSA